MSAWGIVTDCAHGMSVWEIETATIDGETDYRWMSAWEIESVIVAACLILWTSFQARPNDVADSPF